MVNYDKYHLNFADIILRDDFTHKCLSCNFKQNPHGQLQEITPRSKHFAKTSLLPFHSLHSDTLTLIMQPSHPPGDPLDPQIFPSIKSLHISSEIARVTPFDMHFLADYRPMKYSHGNTTLDASKGKYNSLESLINAVVLRSAAADFFSQTLFQCQRWICWMLDLPRRNGLFIAQKGTTKISIRVAFKYLE